MADGEEAKIGNLAKLGRQRVQKDAADELRRGQRHLAELAAAAVVAPAEAHPDVPEGEQTLVGDGHLMGVATEVGEDLGRQEEARAGGDPAIVLGGEAGGRDHAVYVRVELQALAPEVQHSGAADPRAEMGDLAQAHVAARQGMESLTRLFRRAMAATSRGSVDTTWCWRSHFLGS